ncbi:MAG: 5-methyltetrahydropteroyltriglutamate--homocysteine methyltransferase, partial [Alphaproteobacteria bacterium]
MSIPTEPIGSIPRPAYLLEAMKSHGEGELGDQRLAAAMDRAVAETIAALEATGSPVLSDGE